MNIKGKDYDALGGGNIRVAIPIASRYIQCSTLIIESQRAQIPSLYYKHRENSENRDRRLICLI